MKPTLARIRKTCKRGSSGVGHASVVRFYGAPVVGHVHLLFGRKRCGGRAQSARSTKLHPFRAILPSSIHSLQSWWLRFQRCPFMRRHSIAALRRNSSDACPGSVPVQYVRSRTPRYSAIHVSCRRYLWAWAFRDRRARTHSTPRFSGSAALLQRHRLRPPERLKPRQRLTVRGLQWALSKRVLP